MNGRNTHSGHRRTDPRPRRGWPVGWILVACFAALVAGLTTLSRTGVNRVTPAADQQKAQLPAAGPASPPARVCGNSAVLGGGPTSPPSGAVVVPAGNNSRVNWGREDTTYWFAPGVHTLGQGRFDQINPGRGSVYVGAPGAVLDGQHKNFYAFAGHAPRARISYLKIRHFGTWGGNQDEGVVNHDSAHRWTIDHSTLIANAGAATMLGSGNRLSHNCLKNNQQYGFNAYSAGGVSHIVLAHNEIVGNNTYNWERRQPGCGCTGGGKFWAVRGAVVKDNWIHGNHSVGLWADTNNRSFHIEGNYISGNNDSGLVYEISYNALIKDNTFVRNGLVTGRSDPGFPTGAIYLSESGSDSRAGERYGTTFSVTGNTFTDNWAGVILWENADRFCGSPANSSTGDCTLVGRPTVNIHSCNKANIGHSPFYGECRWKTRHVSVNHNVFNFTPANIGPECTVARLCGFQGLFSQYGSYPSWSPYKGTAVENHITFSQHNNFAANTYNGPWRFMVHELGNRVSWATWQGSRYHQDVGSVLNK